MFMFDFVRRLKEKEDAERRRKQEERAAYHQAISDARENRWNNDLLNPMNLASPLSPLHQAAFYSSPNTEPARSDCKPSPSHSSSHSSSYDHSSSCSSSSSSSDYGSSGSYDSGSSSSGGSD